MAMVPASAIGLEHGATDTVSIAIPMIAIVITENTLTLKGLYRWCIDGMWCCSSTNNIIQSNQYHLEYHIHR